jgi:hypothetical protein
MEVSGQLHIYAALPLGERALVTGGSVVPKDSLDAVEKRRSFTLGGNHTRVVQTVARRYAELLLIIFRVQCRVLMGLSCIF